MSAEALQAVRELRYDWAALGRLREDYGAQWIKEAERVLLEPDTATLATILSCAFTADDPRSDVAWWYKESPPVAIMQAHLESALSLALRGVPSQEGGEQEGKRSPPLLTWWRRLIGRGVRSEAAL